MVRESTNAPDYDHDDFEDTCWNCNGQGVVSSCFEEYACIDPEEGCDLCTRRCDVCQRLASPPAQA